MNDKEIASIEVNMAKFVNQSQTTQHLEIPCADDMYNGLFLDIIWTVVEAGDQHSKSTVDGLEYQTMSTSNMNEEDVAELFKKTQELENQNKDLEQQIDLVLNAKNNLEKILVNERKNTIILKKAIEESKKVKIPVLENKKESAFNSEIVYLVSLLNTERTKATDLESEVNDLRSKMQLGDAEVLKEQVSTLSRQKT